MIRGQLHRDTKMSRALSHHIFTAAILLLHEYQDSGSDHDQGHHEVIQTAIKLLDQVSSRNALAQHASSILRERFDGTRIA
jgi:hypothetical protein